MRLKIVNIVFLLFFLLTISAGGWPGRANTNANFGKPICLTVIAGDTNGDCKVDFADYALMATHWLEDNR